MRSTSSSSGSSSVAAAPDQSILPPPAPGGPAAGQADIFIALGLGVLVLILLLTLRPLTGMPMNDDFSYAHSARALAETGRIVYNGWGSPMLWPQAAYGALVIKAFGFSYRALAVTGLVAAMACASLMYLLARRSGAGRFPALLATAVLVLNPMFLGVAPTFMTDLPSLALLFAAFFALFGSLRETPDGLRLIPARFGGAVLLGIIAGTNRQVSWIAFLGALGVLFVYVPAAAARQRRIVAGGILATIGVAAGLTLWFNRQPYTIAADVMVGLILLFAFTNVALMFIYRFLNMAGLFLLPLALLALGASGLGGRNGSRAAAMSRIAFLAALFLVPVFYSFKTTIHLLGDDYRLSAYGQYFTSTGVVVGGVHGFSKRPVVFAPAAITLFVLCGGLGLALSAYLMGAWVKQARSEQARRRAKSIPSDVRVSDVSASMMLAGALFQVAASIPWYAQMNVFDRYLLFVLPGPLILFAVEASRARAPEAAGRRRASSLIGIPAVALAAVLGGIGIAFTYEYFSYTRARATLFHALVTSGVARENVDAGFELDSDTQVRREGHINNERLLNPPGAYHPERAGWFVSYSPEHYPVIQARFVLSTDPTPDKTYLDPRPVRQINYPSPLLPPSPRTMYVYAVRPDAVPEQPSDTTR